MTTNNETRDRLRYESAVHTTQLALDKWTALAYGTDGAKGTFYRMRARAFHRRLSAAIKAAADARY